LASANRYEWQLSSDPPGVPRADASGWVLRFVIDSGRTLRAGQNERVGASRTNRRDAVDVSAWLFLPLWYTAVGKSVSQAAGLTSDERPAEELALLLGDRAGFAGLAALTCNPGLI
jgi:hypothetical protein